MKKITIAAPGPLKHKFIAEGLNYYQTLIKRFAILEVKLPKLKGSYADPEKRKKGRRSFRTSLPSLGL
jgi:hypothetical protein